MFYFPTPTGIELARPPVHLSTPAARCCRQPFVFGQNLPLLLYHISFAGRTPYGVAVTVASVISEDLAAVAKGIPGLGR